MTPSPAATGQMGLYPILFRVGGLEIHSYPFFAGLALIAGALVFALGTRRTPSTGRGTVLILAAGLGGGVLGAKILEFAFHWQDIAHYHGPWVGLLSGRTIIGGFLGGSLAVVLVKRGLGITERRGNLFAPALAVGLAIGRIGCLLGGCCYGKPTDLPWGMNLGDGIPRHPTPIYEMIFAGAAFGVLWGLRRRPLPPGRLFTGFMAAYLGFRFFEEFLRADNLPLAGLSVYQWAAMAGIAWFVLRERFLPRPAIWAPKPGASTKGWDS